MESAVVVKLGGSAITDKSRDCTPNLELIHEAAGEVNDYNRPLVLLHGGGSYAHPFVTRAGLQKGYKGKYQLTAVSETELHLDELTRIIGVSLLLRGKAFVPIKPMSFLTLKAGRIVRCFLEPIIDALRLGFIPLIHGDLAFDKSKGYGIVSADRIASLLGEKLNVSRVLFGCDVDGVYTRNPKISRDSRMLEEVTSQNYRAVLKSFRERGLSDSTGGMKGKVLEAIRLARLGTECNIFNLKREFALRDLLLGVSSPGTRFPSWIHRA